MLVIRDEQLAKDLEQIAEFENRPVEDVLKSMVARHPAKADKPTPQPEKSEAVKQVRRKAYAKARRYWESVGDSAKAAMTDAELDEQFGAFDEEGIPRLKHEISSEPPPGSLAYAARIARRSNLYLNNPDLASQSDEILAKHFAEDYLRRMKGEDVSE